MLSSDDRAATTRNVLPRTSGPPAAGLSDGVAPTESSKVFTTIAPALFGLAGTLVGGLLTFVQQERSGRATRLSETTLRDSELYESRREARRQAAADFLGQVDRLTDRTREFWASLDDQSMGVVARKGTRAAYLDAWRDLVAGFASFQITVNPGLSSVGAELRNAVTTYTDAVEEVAEPEGVTQQASKRAERAQAAVWAARRAFIAAAHADLESVAGSHVAEQASVA